MKSATTFEHPTRCCWCAEAHDCATTTFGDRGPADGDASLCFRCGNWLVFEDAAPGHTRRPTHDEAAQLEADPRCLRIKLAWSLTMMARSMRQ